jgi:hypothetical protein
LLFVGSDFLSSLAQPPKDIAATVFAGSSLNLYQIRWVVVRLFFELLGTINIMVIGVS